MNKPAKVTQNEKGTKPNAACQPCQHRKLSKTKTTAGCQKVAGNEQGFVQAGHCCLSSPELQPNKEIKVQDNN